jgi:hypothetical protein
MSAKSVVGVAGISPRVEGLAPPGVAGGASVAMSLYQLYFEELVALWSFVRAEVW